MPLIQSSLHLLPNPSRVVVRPLQIASEPRDLNPVDNDRMRRIIAAVRAMDGRTTQAELALVLADFESRHREIRKVFEERYDQVASDMGLTGSLDRSQRQLIGAYFCHEYSFGAAAVMNPSIVPHPDQTGLPHGALRFILSLRAVGEGHISSVTFRQGIVLSDGSLELEPEPDLAVAAKAESHDDGRVVFRRHDCSNRLDEMVLFPFTPAQRNGLEDLRLVRFEQDDGGLTYYGTYTAYSGKAISSEILATRDFETFELRPLQGSAARNKGMALFPRSFDGDYLMIGRQDGAVICGAPPISFAGSMANFLPAPNMPGSSFRSATADHPLSWKKGGWCSPTASAPCANIPSGRCCSIGMTPAASSAEQQCRSSRPRMKHAKAMFPTSSTPAGR